MVYKLLFPCLIISCCTFAYANEDNKNIKTQETMVVTASGFEQNIRDASASISIITSAELSKIPFHSLTDAVKHIEGVSITGSNSNYNDISIRGLPGDYTLILVDGKRQNTRDSRPNGNGGFEAGFVPPASAIERIEVVRGPMSSLYGSDAVGGVINIITKKSGDNWQGNLSLDSALQQHHRFGNSYQGNLFLSGPLIDDRLFVKLYGNGQFRQEDKIIDGTFERKNRNIGATFSLTPTKQQRFDIDLGRMLQEREYNKNKTNKTRDGTIWSARNHASLSHTGYWDLGTSEIAIYREVAKRETSVNGKNDNRVPEITNSVIDAKITLPLPANMLTIGGQYQHAKLKDDSVSGALGGSATFEKTSVSVSQKALFIEDEITLTDDLYTTLGARLDHHDKFGNHWSPRGYLVYHLNGNFTLKGGVARAYRAPSIREITPDYLTATNKYRAVIYGNKNLKPEISTTEEIALLYQNDSGIKASITLFNTDFKNKISSWSTGGNDPITGLQLWQYGNVGKANIKGIETSVTYTLSTHLTLTGNYAYLYSKRKSDDETYSATGASLKGDPLAQTPKHKVNLKLDWQITDDLSSYLATTYTGKQIWAASRNSYNKGARYQSSSTLFDIGMSYQMLKHIQLNGALLNLLDKKAPLNAKSGGNWEIIDGRRLWLGLNIDF